MIEKEFLKRVNDNNQDTFIYISKVLVSDTKDVINFIRNNFEIVFNRIKPKGINSFLILLFDYGLEDTIIKNFDLILNRIYKNNIDLDVLILNLTQNDIAFVQKPKNIKKIVENTRDSNLLEVIQILKTVSLESDVYLNTVMENKKEEIVKSMFNYSLNDRMQDEYRETAKKIVDNYLKSSVIAIEELLEYENKQWIDIDVLNGGNYTTAYKIGDKILKIGVNREQYKIPNHRRILQPLIREQLPIEKKGGLICIEIQEQVKTGEFSEDELYEIYQDLRNDGIIWTDVRTDNVGRLIKPNKVHFRETTGVSPDATGFDKELKETKDILPKGKLVILDSDYIYREHDPNIFWLKHGFAREFEEKYKKENRNKKQNERK